MMQEYVEETSLPGLSSESALALPGSANGQESPDPNCKALLPIVSFPGANFQGHCLFQVPEQQLYHLLDVWLWGKLLNVTDPTFPSAAHKKGQVILSAPKGYCGWTLGTL